jgi:tetratricopeptide (TPR) repeat protein
MLWEKRAILDLVLAVGLTAIHCGPRKTIETHREFSDLNYKAELYACKKKVADGFAEKDINYPIYLLNYGAIAQYAGELDSACTSFWAAYRIDEGEMSEFTKGVEWLKADQKRVYSLTKRESELLHFFLGLNYLLTGNPDKAVIEFKKLELIDQSVSVLPIVSFYTGKSYEIMGKYDDAKIEYHRLVSTIATDEFPFVYLALAQSEASLMNYDEANLYFDNYCYIGQISCTENEKKNIIEQNSWHNLIIQIDHQYIRTLGIAKIWVDGKYYGKMKPFDYFNTEMSSGEKMRKTMKEVGSYAARETARSGAEELADKLLPGFGCLGALFADVTLGTDEEDKETRFWNYAPVGFSLIMLPIPNTSQNLKIEFYDCDNMRIGSKYYSLNSRKLYKVGNNIFINPCLDDLFYVY